MIGATSYIATEGSTLTLSPPVAGLSWENWGCLVKSVFHELRLTFASMTLCPDITGELQSVEKACGCKKCRGWVLVIPGQGRDLHAKYAARKFQAVNPYCFPSGDGTLADDRV